MTRRDWTILALLLLLGFALRLYRLDGQSIWFDEAYTLTLSKLPPDELVQRMLDEEDFHPPLHYLLLHYWYKLAGYSVFSARLWSALCGTGCVAAIFLLTRALFDTRTGLVAALLFAVAQSPLMFAQEARPYAQLHLLGLLAAFSFVRAQSLRSRAWWWTFILLCVLLIYTYYYGVLIALSLALWAVAFRSRCRVPLSWWIAGAVVGLVLYLPWILGGILPQLAQGRRDLMVENQPAWFAAHWWSPLRELLSFAGVKTGGFMNDTPRWAMFAAAALVLAPAAAALARLVGAARLAASLGERVPFSPPPKARAFSIQSSHHVTLPDLALPLLLILVPMAVAIAVGMTGGRYAPRYVSMCAAPTLILLAWGILQIRPQPLRIAWLVALLAFNAAGWPAVYSIPYKEDYRSALAHVAANVQPGDCAVCSPFNELPLEWNIYQPSIPPPPVRKVEDVAADSSCARIWCITYRRVGWASRIGNDVEKKLESTCDPHGQWDYYAIRVRLFVPKNRPSTVPAAP